MALATIFLSRSLIRYSGHFMAARCARFEPGIFAKERSSVNVGASVDDPRHLHANACHRRKT